MEIDAESALRGVPIVRVTVFAVTDILSVTVFRHYLDVATSREPNCPKGPVFAEDPRRSFWHLSSASTSGTTAAATCVVGTCAADSEYLEKQENEAMPMYDPKMKPEAVAEILGTDKQAVIRLLDNGMLGYYQLGPRTRRIGLQQLEEYFKLARECARKKYKEKGDSLRKSHRETNRWCREWIKKHGEPREVLPK